MLVISSYIRTSYPFMNSLLLTRRSAGEGEEKEEGLRPLLDAPINLIIARFRHSYIIIVSARFVSLKLFPVLSFPAVGLLISGEVIPPVGRNQAVMLGFFTRDIGRTRAVNNITSLFHHPFEFA